MGSKHVILTLLLVAVFFAGVSEAGGPWAGNHAPIISALGSKEVAVGESLAFYILARDPDNDQIFFSAEELPANAVLHADTGFFRWTPDIQQLGAHRFVFFATDDASPGLSGKATLAVNVVFRTVRRAKKWGLGLKEETAAETSSAKELLPKISGIIIDGKRVDAAKSSFSALAKPVIRIEITSIYLIERESVSAFLDNEPVDTRLTDIRTFGERKNIVSLALEVRPDKLEPGEHLLVVSAGSDLGVTRKSLSLRVNGGKKP